MRTLVLQLARFGDIYQTWPVLKALQRRGDDVHVVVRERFKDALQGLEGVTVHVLPTARILAPIFENENEIGAAQRLSEFTESLLGFDNIVNLSFSPFSSYLSEAVSAESTEVRGYTRFPDGFLCIPDDASAYFYAQAEIGGANRFHITDIFASVAGVELKPEDFAISRNPVPRVRRVIVHMGASQAMRMYPGELWIQALKAVVPSSGADWVLVGSLEERGLADAVTAAVGHPRLTSRVGQTSLQELMQMIASSVLVIGSDSAPAQIAGLTQTPVLQLTSDSANFWTTGPTSAGSRVLYAPELHAITPQRIAEEADGMLRGLEPRGACALRASVLGSYTLHNLEFDGFAWNLIEALYTEASYPEPTAQADVLAFQRLFELSEVAQINLALLTNPGAREVASANLAGVDRLISEVGRLNPRVNPLVQWFETERLRIPPGSMEQTLERTRKIFADLQTIASVYNRFQAPEIEGARVAELCRKLAPKLREYEFKEVEPEFQELVSTLHELSRHSTKVGEQTWSQVLTELNRAMAARDFVEVADQLEYVLVPALS